MRRSNRWAGAIALAWMVGCATPRPQEGAAGAQQRRDATPVKEARLRELPALPLVGFVTPAGVKGRVEARAPVAVATAEGDSEREQVTVQLGTQSELSCAVYASRVDPAGTVVGMVGLVAKELEVIGARPVQVSVEGGVVVLFAEILYHQRTAAGLLAGQLKVAVHSHPTHSLVCTHDEVGYSATFARVVKGLAGSLTSAAADERAGARFAEVQVTDLDGIPLGYVEREIWEAAGGGRRVVTFEAVLIPRSAKELIGLDRASYEESDGEGLLTGARAVHAENGEPTLEVDLARGKAPRTFDVTGRKGGKDLAATFPARDGLASELWFARRLATGARPVSKLTHDAYSPADDPVAPTRASYVRDAAAPARVSFTLGKTTAQCELDGQGLLQGCRGQTRPGLLTQRRIWSRGAP